MSSMLNDGDLLPYSPEVLGYDKTELLDSLDPLGLIVADEK